MNRVKSSWPALLLVELLGWVSIAIGYAAWWSRFAVGAFPHTLLADADLSYPAVLFDDVAYRGGSFAEWRFTPAPYFFPDVLLQALLRPIAGSFELGQALTTMTQFMLVVLAARCAVRALEGERSLASALVPVVFGIWLQFAFYDVSIFGQLILNGIHAGAVMIALACTALLARGDHRRSVVLLGLLSFLGGLSDGLFIVGWVVPVALLSTVGFFERRRGSQVERPSVLQGAVVLVSASVGALIPRLLVRYPTRGHMQTRLVRAPELAQAIVKELTAQPAIVQWNLVSGVIIGALLLFWSRPTRRPEWSRPRATVMLLWAGWFTTLFAIVATGNGLEGAWVRYMLLPFVNAVLISVVAISVAPLPVRVVGAAGLTAWALWGAVVRAPPERWSFGPILPAVEREQAACVDRLAAEENTTSVVSDYWRSKPLTTLSTRDVKVMSYESDFKSCYLWITSNAWYRDDASIIIIDGMKQDAVNARVGEPQQTTKCGGLTFWIYRGEGRARLKAALQSPCISRAH